MYSSVPLRNWVAIVPRFLVKDFEAFFSDALQIAANGMKFPISTPFYIAIENDTSNGYITAIDTALKRDPQLIMCVLQRVEASRYMAIKKRLCVDSPTPSQVIVQRNIVPKRGLKTTSLLSVGTKVAIQINSKLGGVQWMIDIPASGVMVVGFDVCHGTKDKKYSYGALVASMDLKQKQIYFSAVSRHASGVELSNTFANDLGKAIRCYFDIHKVLPQRIMIYRDGVGEGQTKFVYQHELQSILELLKNFYGDKPFKLGFIVVTKRINARFMIPGNNNQPPTNPNPGTVVDDVVTLPERYDFFLISQYSKIGTVSPTNYNVLYDSSGLSTDHLQMFTYKMTHLYYNWPGALAVPSVCQYAHKLAYLVGTFIHSAPPQKLEKQLYFFKFKENALLSNHQIVICVSVLHDGFKLFLRVVARAKRGLQAKIA